MNLTIYLLSSFLGLFLSTTIEKVPINSNYENVLNERYNGGVKQFQADIYNTIRYPRISRQNCEMGQAFVKVEISKIGSIDSIELLNSLTTELDLAIINALNSTSSNWKNAEHKSIFVISFGFRMGQNYHVDGDIMLTAVQVKGPSRECPTSKIIETKMHKAISKKKYKKAKKLCEELLRRKPTNKNYKETYNIITKSI